MKDSTWGVIMFIIALVSLAIMITRDTVNNSWEKEAIKQGNGYYHPMTAKFIWNSEG